MDFGLRREKADRINSSFAYMEMNLILAKMLWMYDLELVDDRLDWLGQSMVHVMWWKPDLKVRFLKRKQVT